VIDVHINDDHHFLRYIDPINFPLSSSSLFSFSFSFSFLFLLPFLFLSSLSLS